MIGEQESCFENDTNYFLAHIWQQLIIPIVFYFYRNNITHGKLILLKSAWSFQFTCDKYTVHVCN